jgi:two-component system, NarL family, nitrate/nitrite response regulator NarL
MNTLPLAAAGEMVNYVVIDDEPLYRAGIAHPAYPLLARVGGYGSVDDFVGLQGRPCHVVVLDLCLNRQTGDRAVLQGVRAIRRLVEEFGQRVLVYTAEERPEPVARCVMAGAAGYVSKYGPDTTAVAQAVDEVGRHGEIITKELHDPLRALLRSCPDVRLTRAQEQTLVLLCSRLPMKEIAARQYLTVKTIEQHKTAILKQFNKQMDSREMGFAELAHFLGVLPGDLVNDEAGSRVGRGRLAQAMPWVRRNTRKSR